MAIMPFILGGGEVGGKVLSWIISLSANPADVCCHRLKAIHFFILK